MPFDEFLANRIRSIMAETSPAKEKRMFGGLAFLVNGHMSCGIVGEDLVVRVGPTEYPEALSRPHARSMDFTGRPMQGFVYVGPLGCRTDAELRSWIKQGLRFVLTLPP